MSNRRMTDKQRQVLIKMYAALLAWPFGVGREFVTGKATAVMGENVTSQMKSLAKRGYFTQRKLLSTHAWSFSPMFFVKLKSMPDLEKWVY